MVGGTSRGFKLALTVTAIGSQIPFPLVLSAFNLTGVRYQGHSED